MAFNTFDADVEVHSKLGDDPNVDNNLTADELKALFDSPMVAFKDWINKSLIPGLNAISAQSSVAVFIQPRTPDYSPCFWFRPLPGGSYEMNFINSDGEIVNLNVIPEITTASIRDRAVTTAKVADRAITSDKLDKAYFAKLEAMVLQENVHYGNSLPAPGAKGRIFFKKVT